MTKINALIFAVLSVTSSAHAGWFRPLIECHTGDGMVLKIDGFANGTYSAELSQPGTSFPGTTLLYTKIVRGDEVELLYHSEDLQLNICFNCMGNDENIRWSSLTVPRLQIAGKVASCFMRYPLSQFHEWPKDPNEQ